MAKLSASVWAVLLSIAPVSGAEREFVRAFPVEAAAELLIDTHRGSVTVEEADTTEVRVAVRLEIGAENEAEAERLLASFHLDTAAAANRVTVIARDPRDAAPRFVWNDDKQVEPTFRVTVPRQLGLTVRTGKGSVIVGRLEGQVKAEVRTGDVFLRGVKGGADVRVEEGSLVVSRVEGPLLARVKRGQMHVGTVTGLCDLRNESGDVEALGPKGEVRIYAEAGNVVLALPRDFVGPAEVRTSGGPIIAEIEPGARCQVEASASVLARVRNRLPLDVTQGGDGKRRLLGALNGGGARVQLRASGGDVVLRPAKLLLE